MLLASTVNRKACIAWIEKNATNVCIICAGTDGEVAAEDILVAGGLISGLNKYKTLGDAAQLTNALWNDSVPDANRNAQQRAVALLHLLENCEGGKNLIQTGFTSDLEFAAKLDNLSAVPIRCAGEEYFRLPPIRQ